MDRDEVLLAARADLADGADRLDALLRAQPHLDVPLGGGSVWTARDAAVHLSALGIYADIAAGMPSPLRTLDRAAVARLSQQYLDDVAETDPGKVADLVAASAGRFLGETAGWAGDHPVTFHAGARTDLAGVTTIAVQEVTLHGHDIAAALGAPWPIRPEVARRLLGTFVHRLPRMLDAPGHTASYALVLDRTDFVTLRVADGAASVEPAGTPGDCVIDTDPVTLLLTLTGRLPVPEAIALGRYRGRGARADLAPAFPGLVRYP